MTLEREKIARLWKAGRLLAGLTQQKISQQLSIPQSSVSKFESGVLEPSAIDWFRFCELVGIDAHRSLHLGVIDGRQKFRDSMYLQNLFRFPLRYRLEQALKIRELVAFKEAAIELLGQESWKNFLRESEIDENIFYVMDFQVSLNFLLDLFIWSNGREEELMDLACMASTKLRQHGLVGTDLLKKRHLNDFLEALKASQDFYQRALHFDLTIFSDRTQLILRSDEYLKNTFNPRTLELYLSYKTLSVTEIIRGQFPQQEVPSFHQTAEGLVCILKTA
jgi:transcriptional regulator with XRE-family HTH domain